jgi:hypothetical protein
VDAAHEDVLTYGVENPIRIPNGSGAR